MADKNVDNSSTITPVAPDDTVQYLAPQTLKPVTINGFRVLACSADNGVNWVPEYTAQGKMYHQRDINRISSIPFDKILMRSPNKAVFSFAVSDDGELKITKIADPPKKAGDDK